MRHAVYVVLALLYLAHTDVWYWNDPTVVFALPIGMTYHVLWIVAVSGAFWLAVQYAWPDELEGEATLRDAASAPPAGPSSALRDAEPQP